VTRIGKTGDEYVNFISAGLCCMIITEVSEPYLSNRDSSHEGVGKRVVKTRVGRTIQNSLSESIAFVFRFTAANTRLLKAKQSVLALN
jgi:hypothetical protein